MSNLKKVVALALALALVLTMFASATIKTELPYTDVAEFTDAQLSAAAILKPLGITEGTGAGELGAGPLTRAQMVTFIYRLLNGGDYGVQNYYSKTSIFSDVDPEAWYAPYINWAYAAKIVEGYGKTFGPEDKVTGAQAAAMLVRIFGKVVTGADYAQKAESYAIAYGLDYGVETKGVYENELGRGDMFIFVANALLVEYEKDRCIATDIFDLEVINGAILLGEDKIGSNGYSVFAFRTGTDGNVKYFWTDLLCIEEDSDVFEDYGCKYTLLVSKDQINVPTYNQGYRWLYAAYEESQNAYYKVVTGTVDDGKLVFEGRTQNVFFDKNVFVYVNGKAATVEDFIASYGVRNMARYKLIDNDGDGEYEFAIIERLKYGDLKTETINAKVTAVSADGGTITLTKADGTSVTVKLGNFWNDKYEVVENNIYMIWNALGINQQDAEAWNQPNYGVGYFGGYMPYTAISDVYYDFVIGGGYLFNVKAASNTKFSGNYGIFVMWSTPLTMYKNMPYALFVNEQSEYFWAYVQTIDEAPSISNYNWVLANTLVYFTEGDASDDVVSFDTAGFWNSNYTYKELMLAYGEQATGAEQKITVDFLREDGYGVVSEMKEKETYDYSSVAEFGSTYAVFDVDPGDPNGDGDTSDALMFWNVARQEYRPLPAATLIDTSANRTIDGIPMQNYKDLEGKYIVKIPDSARFYGIEDMEECLGFVFVADAKIEVTLSGSAGDSVPQELQIYKRNGFWHLRFYSNLEDLTEEDVVITWNGHLIGKVRNPNTTPNEYWAIIDLKDGTDPETNIERAEKIRLAELVKGFNDDEFTDKIAEAIADFVAANPGGMYMRSDYTLLNDGLGVIFAYGDVVAEGATVRRWVAYDAKTFNANFGLGDPFYMIDTDGDGRVDTEVPNDTVPFGYTADELIYCKIGGTMYIKALKVSDYKGVLPYGWLEPNGYELVVFGGFAGGVNTNGWGIKLVSFDGEKIKIENVYTKIGLNGAGAGDVMLVKRDASGNLTELLAVGDSVLGYLDYATSYRQTLKNAPLVSATKIAGNDARGDYYEVNLTGKTVYYMWVNAAGELLYTDDFSKVPGKNRIADVWTVGKVYVVFINYYE